MSGDATTARRGTTGPFELFVDIALPLILYYGLRAAGVGIYLALVLGSLIPGFRALYTLVRGRAAEGLATFMATTMLLGLGVALIAGSPRLLLAKEGAVTAVVGGWFLASTRGRRPLAFLFTRALLEGRRRFTSRPWDELWEESPAFRRSWRVSSAIWGVGLMGDAVVRVVLAYTLPVDLVPALTTVLYVATSIVLQAVDQLHQHRSGVRDVICQRPRKLTPAAARP